LLSLTAFDVSPLLQKTLNFPDLQKGKFDLSKDRDQMQLLLLVKLAAWQLLLARVYCLPTEYHQKACEKNQNRAPLPQLPNFWLPPASRHDPQLYNAPPPPSSPLVAHEKMTVAIDHLNSVSHPETDMHVMAL
jgi:hypothetical protein